MRDIITPSLRPILATLARLAFAALGPLLYLAPLAAAALLPLTALLGWSLAGPPRWPGLRADLRAAWPLAPLVLLLPLSALWALDAQVALVLAVRLVALLACGVVLAGSLRRIEPEMLAGLLAALAWGLIVAAVAVIGDLAAGGALVRLLHAGRMAAPIEDAYSRGSVFQAILTAPLGIGLWLSGRRRLALLQILVAAVAIFAGVQLAAKLALAGGLAAGGAVMWRPVLRWAVPVAFVLLLAGLPLAFPLELPWAERCWLADHKGSALHRVLIWDWVDARIREKPLLGWGLDASRRMPGGHEHVQIRSCYAPPSRPPYIDNEVLPLHPHNAVLQIWLELGAAGAFAVGLAALVPLLRRYRQLPGRRAAALAAGAGASLTGTLLSFGIWQEWWVSALLIAAAASAVLDRLPALVRPDEGQRGGK